MTEKEIRIETIIRKLEQLKNLRKRKEPYITHRPKQLYKTQYRTFSP